MPECMRVFKEITESRDQQALIFVEMATVYDVFRPLVSATYNLEGDGPLPVAIFAFDEVMFCDTHLHQLANLAIEDNSIALNIIATCNMACYEWKVFAPGTRGTKPTVAWLQYSKMLWRDSLTYWEENKRDRLSTLPILEAARLWLPTNMENCKVDADWKLLGRIRTT
jgi:hypothetical protein